MSSSGRIFDLPSSLTADELIPAINDRLRRLAQPVSSAGSSSPTSSKTVVTKTVTLEGYYVIPVGTGKHATPNLSRGINQEVSLTESGVTIDPPANAPGPITWTLFIVQDSTGGWAVAFDPTAYVGAAALAAMLNTAAATYSSLDFVVRADGKNALSNIVTGVPLI